MTWTVGDVKGMRRDGRDGINGCDVDFNKLVEAKVLGAYL